MLKTLAIAAVMSIGFVSMANAAELTDQQMDNVTAGAVSYYFGYYNIYQTTSGWHIVRRPFSTPPLIIRNRIDNVYEDNRAIIGQNDTGWVIIKK